MPHLIVGIMAGDGDGRLREAAAGLAPVLPVRTLVSRAWLMAGPAARAAAGARWQSFRWRASPVESPGCCQRQRAFSSAR